MFASRRRRCPTALGDEDDSGERVRWISGGRVGKVRSLRSRREIVFLFVTPGGFERSFDSNLIHRSPLSCTVGKGDPGGSGERGAMRGRGVRGGEGRNEGPGVESSRLIG